MADKLEELLLFPISKPVPLYTVDPIAYLCETIQVEKTFCLPSREAAIKIGKRGIKWSELPTQHGMAD
jgi:hypothetical protein